MIYLVEHGQTALDAEGQSHGGRDVPLDREGRKQAIALGLRLRRANPKPDVIFHSPRKRAMQTAKLAGHVARIPVEEREELSPLKSGDLGAGPEAQVARRLAPYFADQAKRIPGGESVSEFRRRHERFMQKLAASGRPAAVVTHSNVIGSLRGGAQGALKAMASSPKPATPVRYTGA